LTTKSKKSKGNQPFEMSVDLSVVESLGINLYSNAAAVLTELVANGYDADAGTVTIDWKNGDKRVVVTDDGAGMTKDELNKRFLKVGYKKRQKEGTSSPKWKRPFMGRKGIGKLSVFSIAERVTVYSTKSGKSHGLKIEVPDLEKAIKANKPYFPKPVPVPKERRKQGTTIVLDRLKKKRAKLTANALRKRLARRFDVMDETPVNKGGFRIEVNGKRITWKDRQELKKLEFIWEFGEESIPASALPKDVKRFVIKDTAVNRAKKWMVGGWFGTAKKPTDLTEDADAGSLKNIIVLARKRPIQEGIIEKLDFSKLFGNYVTGQIEADFLDLDGEHDDIATSDRQRLIEDDDRYIKLRDFLRDQFGKAATVWSKERPKKEAKDALEKHPRLREWVDSRPGWQKDAAEQLIGTIASIELEKGAEEERAALYRSGILAFERVGLREVATELESLSSVTAADLLPLLGAQDDYEASMWGDILRSRIEAIDQFRGLTKANEKEKVLQEHLFKHLWLLDPSWERTTLGGRMEEDLKDISPGLFATDDEGKRLYGRVDIRYATASGSHVIVELKRYSVKPKIDVLVEQGLKYYTAMKSLLKQQHREDEPVSVVFVLGHHPRVPSRGAFASDNEAIEHALESLRGRFVLYDELIENAKQQYEEYLEKSDEVKKLDDLLAGLSLEVEAAT
jgi:Histidine kinase-, DNA gyrase B-, and HSP90-like ATPase